jgi:chitinase domain-containing protein 1
MIFLGINFYGNDFLLSRGSGGGAITGKDYVHLLEKYKPSLQRDEKSACCILSNIDVTFCTFG